MIFIKPFFVSCVKKLDKGKKLLFDMEKFLKKSDVVILVDASTIELFKSVMSFEFPFKLDTILEA